MVSQYPHTITIANLIDFEQDGNGNFQPEETSLNISKECRCEPAKFNPVLTGTDGQSLAYEWIIYMPAFETQLPFGTEVTLVTQDGTYTGTIKRQITGSFNTRLWV